MNNQEKQLLDSVDVAIFVLERDTADQPAYVGLNAYACKKAGFSLSNVLGKTAKEIYPGRFGQLAYENHCACLASGQKTTYGLQLSLTSYNAHITTVLAPIKDESGQVVRIVGTSTITDAENLIRETHEKSVVLNAEIEQLINLSAHDLRSPMRNVKQLSEMLAEDFVDLGDGKLEIVGMLKKVGNSTFSLIDNILEYAQTTGKAEPVEEFELAPLCREILSMLDPANKHKADIEQVCIYGDKMAIQITLRNLIDNAFKHNERAVTVSVNAIEQGPEQFQITVADDGIGTKNPQELFDQNAPRRIDSGFGLHGVTRMLNKRGGVIAASESESGNGIIVRFTLPGRIVNKS